MHELEGLRLALAFVLSRVETVSEFRANGVKCSVVASGRGLRQSHVLIKYQLTMTEEDMMSVYLPKGLIERIQK